MEYFVSVVLDLLVISFCDCFTRAAGQLETNLHETVT